AALRRRMARTQFHDELHTLLLEHNRVCILAPRSHGKSEAVVNHVAWRCWRQPGLTVMVFSATENLASKLKGRVDAAVEEAQPAMMPRRPPSDSATTFTNGSVLEAAGTGVSTRGLHPDLIIGDDVLTEDSA